MFELVKKIWIREFRMSEKDVNNAPLGKNTIVVMYRSDAIGNSNPLSSARFEIYQDPKTHKNCEDIFSGKYSKEKRIWQIADRQNQQICEKEL